MLPRLGGQLLGGFNRQPDDAARLVNPTGIVQGSVFGSMNFCERFGEDGGAVTNSFTATASMAKITLAIRIPIAAPEARLMVLRFIGWPPPGWSQRDRWRRSGSRPWLRAGAGRVADMVRASRNF